MLQRRDYQRLAIDTLMAGISFPLALFLRLGSDVFERDLVNILFGTIIFTLISFSVFLVMRTYKHFWRYISVENLVNLMQSVSLAVLLFLPAMFVFNRLEDIPRSLILIQWLVLMASLSAPRLLRRILNSHFSHKTPSNGYSEKIKVLVAGINEYSDAFIRYATSHPHGEYEIVGVLSDDSKMNGGYMRGMRLYGPLNNLTAIYKKLHRQGKTPQKVIIAPDLYDGEKVKQLMEQTTQLGMTINRLPRINMLEKYEDKVSLRHIAVEDLLGRPQTTLDIDSMENLVAGKNVLVTGAGGSIGSELVKQIAYYKPKSIVVMDYAEFPLYQIDYEMAELFPDISTTPVLVDIRDEARLQMTFAKHKPDLVFHAAALKQVPLCEIHASQAAETNVLGTCNIADMCIKYSTSLMVMISTDKAVEPSSIMGMTKRAAEYYIQDYAEQSEHTKFITVRFGNVLGSKGSVVPIFQRQLEAGGPLTVTDPSMMRYFMTIREASQLVIQAAALGLRSPQKSSLYVLDMGELIYIKDLAEHMIQLAGLHLDKDVSIVYTGVRPGEKMIEKLFYSHEKPQRTDAKSVLHVELEPQKHRTLKHVKQKISNAVKTNDHNKVITLLQEVVPEYLSYHEHETDAKVA